MPRGGIILQPLLFDPGVVTPLSPAAVPPAGGGGAGGGGSGGVLGPILAGLLLLFAAFGFPWAAAPPPPAPAQVTPAGSATPQSPSQPGASPGLASSPGTPPPASAVSPAQVPNQTPGANVPPVGPPGRVAPVVLSSVPRRGSSQSVVAKAGPIVPTPQRRPILPFTGANLLLPMAAGAGLILAGLILRYRGGTA
jgi:hypothetical protein